MDAGPQFPFTEAFSVWVDCEDQAEVDHYWGALLAGGGEESQCGWLKDKFGFSWQVAPARMMELLFSSDKAASQRAFDAMMTMRKIDLAAVERAYAG
jgi:predicted 3-demethylubiquinone-9 3-methyltransferase (glyoxalase superfamily)